MRTLINASLALRTLCLAALLSASPAFGSTIVVSNTNDSGPGSLRAAIDTAATGDTIQFNLSLPATITVQSALFVTGKTIAISGPGASSLFISGNQNVPVFVFHGGATISGLTIEHGNSLLGGCIFNGAETLTLIDSRVFDCFGQLGGGIFNAGSLNLVNSTISGGVVGLGTQPGIGGGILNFGGTVTLTGSTVSDNYALFPACYQGNTMRGCGGGGGIYNTAEGKLTLTNSTLSKNTSIAGGGLLNLNGKVTLTNSTVANNTTFSDGGGIENASELTAIGSTISGNLSYGQDFSYTIVDRTTIPLPGECDPTDPTDPDCVIIYLEPPPQFTRGGGGIHNRGGAVLSNTTLAGNSVENHNGEAVGGGAILVSGTLFLSNVTVSGNSATCEFYGTNLCTGGGIFSAFAHIEIKNSLFANAPQVGGNCSIHGGDLVSGDHNLSDDATCPFSAAGDMNTAPAGLDSAGLTNNGGTTNTVALLPASLAVNAIPPADCTDLTGMSVDADQRGVLRPQQSGCDIGAYEYFASAFPTAALKTYRLVGTVKALPLTAGLQQSLALELQAAADAMNQGKAKVAGNQLRAFINHVNALTQSGALSPAQGSLLAAEAQGIIQMIGG